MEKETIYNNGTDRVKTLILSTSNKSEFISILTNHLNEHFQGNLHENYGYKHPWSLLSLIENDEIDTYMLIYVNDILWGGTGGMVRMFNDEKVYQGGFRVFTKTRTVHNSIGSKTYIHEYGTKYQIERANILGCKSLILSFNEYNTKFYRLTKKYHLPKTFGDSIVWQSYDKMIEFNGVPQWLLVTSLS